MYHPDLVEGVARLSSHKHLAAMSNLATIPAASAPIQPQSEQKPVQKKRIPRRIAEVVRLLVTGECKTQRAAAQRAGMSETYLSTALSKPEILEYIEQQTRVSLKRLQAPAAATLARLMTEAASEHVQKDVAIHALAINGHKPQQGAQVSVNVNIRAGYVIDLSDDPRAARVVEHQSEPQGMIVTHDERLREQE